MSEFGRRLDRFVFVVFSDDWGRHPSSCQHIFTRILPHADVLWVNTVGLRTPRLTLYDVKRAFQVVFSWLNPFRKSPPAGPEETARAPAVIRPAMWPSFRNPWIANINQALLARAVQRALAKVFAGKEPILVSTLPIVPGLFRDRRFRKKVYYCVDDFTQWAGIDGEAMARLEAQTLSACDLLIATSTSILETRGRGLARSCLLTHGVDVAHFSQRVKAADSALASLPGPIVGIFGVFDRRIDNALFRAVAKRLPHASIVVVGPVMDQDVTQFADLANVHFLGSVPYARLPGQVAWFDVCMLPYLVDSTTWNINPLKLKEYLATGKPVVTTPLPEAVKLGAFLTLADADGFPDAVSAALDGVHTVPPGLPAFLSAESWEAKASAFVAEILKDL